MKPTKFLIIQHLQKRAMEENEGESVSEKKMRTEATNEGAGLSRPSEPSEGGGPRYSVSVRD
jgi:hypothetical protein